MVTSQQQGSPPGVENYHYPDAGASCAHEYLLPAVTGLVRALAPPGGPLLDLGCGNGVIAAHFHRLGYRVIGVDPSIEGIAQGRSAWPELELHRGSTADDLALTHGRFPLVYSLEVVEHAYAPRQFAATLLSLLEPGGHAIISTPFHGYWKNLALAAAGQMDRHYGPLWDHGHIKFWSERTLRTLLDEVGFEEIWFERVGRFPPLAKSMIAIARRPQV